MERVQVRNTLPQDFAGITTLTRRVYGSETAWMPEQLASHLRMFPEGQFVAVDTETNAIAGMAASLIVRWDDYDFFGSWRHFTDAGLFTNHDPERGRTLYAAEVMVDPDLQGHGIGSRIYQARSELVERRGLLRIRAGARLRGYHKYSTECDATTYVRRVVRREIRDPTLSFQLRRGFRVLAVVEGYLRHDPESLGYAAVIEWLNPRVAKPEDWAGQDPRFA